jgi:hypothetical protein
VVHLESLIQGVVVIHLSFTLVVPPSIQQTIAKNLEDISIVCEFLDVFPGDLLGMLPDQDVHDQ